jgi:hypothetical protein
MKTDLQAIVYIYARGAQRQGFILAGNKLVDEEIEEVGGRSLEDMVYPIPPLPEANGLHELHAKLAVYEDDCEWQTLTWHPVTVKKMEALASGKPVFEEEEEGP